MKKLLIVLLFLATERAVAQKVYVESQGQLTLRQQGDFGRELYKYTFVSYTGAKGLGAFIEGGTEDGETNYANPGILFGKDLGKRERVYIEVGAGPDVDYFVRTNDDAVLGVAGYGYFELRQKKDTLRPIFMFSSSFYHSKEFGVWHMSYAVIKPLKWLEVGWHMQTEALNGFRAGITVGPMTLYGAIGQGKKLLALRFAHEFW